MSKSSASGLRSHTASWLSPSLSASIKPDRYVSFVHRESLITAARRLAQCRSRYLDTKEDLAWTTQPCSPMSTGAGSYGAAILGRRLYAQRVSPASVCVGAGVSAAFVPNPSGPD